MPIINVKIAHPEGEALTAKVAALVVAAFADAYGFGGRTQEHRYVEKQLGGTR